MDYFFGILFAFIFGFFLISYVVTSLCELFLFRKAGVPGWQAFVPILNTYRLCEIAKAKDFFIWIMIVSLMSPTVTSAFEILNVEGISGLLSLLIYIIQIWLIAIVYKRIAESFGYDGWGWVILMILIAPITFLIMGLNDSKYEEPTCELFVKDYIQHFRKE